MIFFNSKSLRLRLASRPSDFQRDHLATEMDDRPCSLMFAQFGMKISSIILLVLGSDIQRIHEAVCQSSSTMPH